MAKKQIVGNCIKEVQLYDTEGYYFCENGVPDGDVHVVLRATRLKSNILAMAKTGKLSQNDNVAGELYTKYFGK